MHVRTRCRVEGSVPLCCRFVTGAGVLGRREQDWHVWRIAVRGELHMRLIFAPSTGLAPVLAVALLSAASTTSIAQNNEHEWQKSYPLSGSASLTVETGDSNLNVHSCGECKAIQIRVLSGRNLNQY